MSELDTEETLHRVAIEEYLYLLRDRATTNRNAIANREAMVGDHMEGGEHCHLYAVLDLAEEVCKTFPACYTYRIFVIFFLWLLNSLYVHLWWVQHVIGTQWDEVILCLSVIQIREQ